MAIEDVESNNSPQVTRNFALLGRQITWGEETTFIQGMLDSTTDRLWAVVDQGSVHLEHAGIHEMYWLGRNGRLGSVIGRQGSRERLLRDEYFHEDTFHNMI